MSDFDAIDILADDGTPQRVAAAHATDAAIATLAEQTACDLRDGTSAMTLAVLRSGSPHLQEDIDSGGFELFLATAELTPDQHEVARRMPPELSAQSRTRTRRAELSQVLITRPDRRYNQLFRTPRRSTDNLAGHQYRGAGRGVSVPAYQSSRATAVITVGRRDSA
jgi:hypothetical protein